MAEARGRLLQLATKHVADAPMAMAGARSHHSSSWPWRVSASNDRSMRPVPSYVLVLAHEVERFGVIPSRMTVSGYLENMEGIFSSETLLTLSILKLNTTPR